MPLIYTSEYRKLKGRWAVRYVDDIIMTSLTKELIETEYIPKLKHFLSERGLRISESKSKIINLNLESFRYLGWNIKLIERNLSKNRSSVNKSVLIIKPTSEAVKRIKMSIKQTFRANLPLKGIIRKLNPVTRGWTNYYRVSFHSQKQFAHLSNYIYLLWWRWALRTHPNRSKKWIHSKYIFKTSTHSWQIGIKSTMLILYPTNVKSIKTAAMKVNINPYVDKEYFEKRYKILDVEKFRKTIYIKHGYKCAACGELLGDTEQIDLHHIVPRSEGGKYTVSNILPLHKTCHESVTYAKRQWFKNLNIKK